jgi:predicted PhzF superfamily epimerase YddE/YHI9
MTTTITLDVEVLRVFAAADGAYGNELGLVYGAAQQPSELGIRLAAHLGFSETVFVDDTERAAYRIFTPTSELKLAGHPTVGTAWSLAARTGAAPAVVRPRLAAEVPTWREPAGPADGGDLDPVWIRVLLEDAVPWTFVRLDAPAEVDALSAAFEPGSPDEPLRQRHLFWAWLDEPAGLVRARAFCRNLGIAEDEATGSAAVGLTHALGRSVGIRQGRGSVIEARPAADPAYAEIGGRVVSDGVRAVTF